MRGFEYRCVHEAGVRIYLRDHTCYRMVPCMDRQTDYRGFSIDAHPQQLDAPIPWSVDINIIARNFDGTIEMRDYSAEETFPTEEVAIAACFRFGQQIIDGEYPGLEPPPRH